MSEHLRLYRTIMGLIGQTLRMNDIRNVSTFAWMVVGLLLSKGVHLSQWAVHRVGAAQAASKQRQMARWLHNSKLEPATVYREFITAALLSWAAAPERALVLALDSSVLWEKYVIVRVSLVYRGRALPLAWTVLAQGSASVSLDNYRNVLVEASRLLPRHQQVTLLADRGFVDVALLQLLVEVGWHFTIRLKSSLWVYRACKPRCKVKALLPPKGEVRLFHCVQVTERRFGPVHLILAHVRTAQGCEQWSLLSDRPTSHHTLDEYALRFDIEENFLDDKSAAFQLESSEVRNADALARLCLVLAVATVYLVSQGTAVVALNLRPTVDTHWQRGLSYLQLGWRYLIAALAANRNILTTLWLDPDPDPEPVYASRKQAQTFSVAFSAISLEH